mgnify:CR=1 FL=1
MNKLQKIKKYFVGIDISKNFFDFTIIDQFGHKLLYKNFDMNKIGFRSFHGILKKYEKSSVQITIESTGIYFYNLCNYLNCKDFDVAVVNPLLVHNFHKSMNLRKTKTDKKDSYIIALFTLKNLENIKQWNKQNNTLKSICRERDNNSEEIAKIKTQIKAFLSTTFPELEKIVDIFSNTMLELLKVAGSCKTIAALRVSKIERIFNKTQGNKIKISAKELKQYARNSIGSGDKNLDLVLHTLIIKLQTIRQINNMLERKIEEFVNENWSSEMEILTSIKGVGKITSQKFLVEVEDVFNFQNHKQLTAFAGTDPSIKQSGTSISINGRISKRGNKYLRKTLYQMAQGCIKYNNRLNEYFHKKRNEKKKYKQAIIAVANKLIRIIFALLTKKELYCET